MVVSVGRVEVYSKGGWVVNLKDREAVREIMADVN